MSPDRARTARAPRTAPATRRATDEIAAPTVMDRYRLQRRLGSGAFGTVWLARDERLQRDVAVKILARQLVAGGRFEREARAAARLSHPGIVTLYEAAVDDEGAYLVSELVRGDTLDALLAQGLLSDRDILEIGVALCDALAHAHEQGVVHRDVKPSNVLVPDARGTSAPAAKLTDFGVARVIESESLTLTGDVVGTLAYMAPEQAAGLEAGDEADLYSLALVLYEALSGINPVRAWGRVGSVSRRARLGAQLPPLRRQRRDLPGPLAQAIDRALRPRPEERGTIAALRDGLAGGVEHVGDDPGIVTGALDRRGPVDEEGDDAGPLWSPRPSAAPAPPPEPDPSRLIWQARALGAVAGAATAAWLSHRLLAPGAALAAPLPVTALVAGGITLLLPRLGWLAIVAYLCAATAVAGHPGLATVIAAGAVVPIVLLPAAPSLWPASAAAPALGLIGLAGAWPALAGYARSPWRRAMLGATGWLWLSLAAPLTARTLYLRRPAAIPPRPAWSGSIAGAATHVLEPLAHSGVLAPAVVWAAAAVLAPWMLGRRSALADGLCAVAWSAALTIATGLAITAVHGSHRLAHAPTATAGAVAAAVVMLLPLGIRRLEQAVRAPSLRSRVP